jgi:hypothetical protein
MGEMRNAQQNFGWKVWREETTRKTWAQMGGWMDLWTVGWKGVDWTHLAQDRGHWRAPVNPVINFQVHERGGSSWLSDYKLLQRGFCSMDLFKVTGLLISGKESIPMSVIQSWHGHCVGFLEIRPIPKNVSIALIDFCTETRKDLMWVKAILTCFSANLRDKVPTSSGRQNLQKSN